MWTGPDLHQIYPMHPVSKSKLWTLYHLFVM